MVDITKKTNTLRTATAQAIVAVSSIETIKAIQEDRVPKGNVFAMSKAAGLLGVKKTPDILPDCHPLPIEFTGIEYNITKQEIEVTVTVKTIYKTGVEVEAMHGASVVALNMYDMLKPIDKGIEIKNIKLVTKSGGKSSFKKPVPEGIKAAVIVCSDRVSQGLAEDKSGKMIKNRLREYAVNCGDVTVLPDEKEQIAEKVSAFAKANDLIILTGGTGLSQRDVTPEAVAPLLDRRILGAEETLRRYGQERMPFAMLSRSLVGTIGRCVVIALPGSSKGVEESMDALFPWFFHVFSILKGEKH